MKIADVRVVSKRMNVHHVALVEVESDDGIVGIGATSAPIPVISAMVEQDRGLRPLLIDQDPSDPSSLWRVMFEGWQAQRGRGGEGGVGVNAMAAIDMAIWDLVGKASGRPVHQMLGEAVKERVTVYASATYADQTKAPPPGGGWAKKTTEMLVVECNAYMAEGFKAVKFGWGNNQDDEDMENLQAIRETVGPDVKLMVDFGCPAYLEDGWSVAKAIALAEKLVPLDLYFLEEALHPHDAEGFAELTKASPIPIASGESLVTLSDFGHFIRRQSVDILQPDAQQTGITVFKEVADRANAAGIRVIPHCPWTAMAIASHLQVLSLYDSTDLIEYPAMAGFPEGSQGYRRTGALNFRIVETPPAFDDGHILLSDGPGLGLGQYVPEAMAGLE